MKVAVVGNRTDRTDMTEEDEALKLIRNAKEIMLMKTVTLIPAGKEEVYEIVVEFYDSDYPQMLVHWLDRAEKLLEEERMICKGLCFLCGTTKNITKHHEKPATFNFKRGRETVKMCKPCQGWTHSRFSNAELRGMTMLDVLNVYKKEVNA